MHFQKYSRLSLSRSPRDSLKHFKISIPRQPPLTEWICNLTPKLEIYWKYCGKEENSPVFHNILLPVGRFCVKAGTRFSLRGKQLFEISEFEITRVNCIFYGIHCNISVFNHWVPIIFTLSIGASRQALSVWIIRVNTMLIILLQIKSLEQQLTKVSSEKNLESDLKSRFKDDNSILIKRYIDSILWIHRPRRGVS